MAEEEYAARARKAVGPDRPVYFNQADTDRVMAVLLALVSEVSSMRDRIDTHERLAAEGSPPAFDVVEAYTPDKQVSAARDAWRDSFIRRLFRVITEDIEALRPPKTGPG